MESFTTNTQLERYARRHQIPLNGVFARDGVPRALHDGGYIVNLQTTAEPGTHWVCFYIEGPNAVYFDPFGEDAPLEVDRALKPYKYTTSREVIQNLFCGW
jgi:hypothetical protein